MHEAIRELVSQISVRSKIAVLTGAGISAESGIPTFRAADGLWENYKIEEVATPEGFTRDPLKVWEFYRQRQMQASRSKPNAGHLSLAQMEKWFPEFTVITQNIDNLHQKAGQSEVLELHGNLWRARCLREGTVRDFAASSTPDFHCACGAWLRPDVVWFGEALPQDILARAYQAAQACDFFFSIGTSALVFPAAGLPVAARQNGALVVEINLQPTALTPICDYSFLGKAGEILPQLAAELKANL